jgi:hypothetical protein
MGRDLARHPFGERAQLPREAVRRQDGDEQIVKETANDGALRIYEEVERFLHDHSFLGVGCFAGGRPAD